MGFISPENPRIEVPPLDRFIWEMVKQIPEGMISTYGDLAKALGDVRAARAVGTILARNPAPIVVPCHRVIYSDGKTGWYGGSGEGRERKIELLRKEGVCIKGDKVVNFSRIRFTDFHVRPVLAEMAAEQKNLSQNVILKDGFGHVTRVAGVDVAYDGERTYAAKVVFDLEKNEIIETEVIEGKTKFPYIPGYLSYREIPALEGLIEFDEETIFMIDGQGVLHPRRFGIACHIGVFFNVPTIGVAKSHLSGVVTGTGKEKAVLLGDKVMGVEMSGSGGRGIFISPGHKISLETSVHLCRQFLRYRIPEPLRMAHILASGVRKERG